MRRFRFRALITLCPAEPDSLAAHASSPRHQGHTCALVILARPLPTVDGPARYLPTEIWWDGETLLYPRSHALVTVKVIDDQAGDFLADGQPFTLWCGGQVGHGTVVGRVLEDYDPS